MLRFVACCDECIFLTRASGEVLHEGVLPWGEFLLARLLCRHDSLGYHFSLGLVGEDSSKKSRPPDVVEAPAATGYVASDEDLDPAFFGEPPPTATPEELDAELARLEELRAILEGVK